MKDIVFVEYNLVNGLFQAQQQNTNNYIEYFRENVNSKQMVFLTILLVSLALMVIQIFIMIPIFIQANQNQQEILQLFLDIPEQTAKILYQKVEVFLSTLQLGEEDKAHSEDDKISHEKQDEEEKLEQTFGSKAKRKKFKSSTKSRK